MKTIKILVELDENENKIVELFKILNNLKTKEQAIKLIISNNKMLVDIDEAHRRPGEEEINNTTQQRKKTICKWCEGKGKKNGGTCSNCDGFGYYYT